MAICVLENINFDDIFAIPKYSGGTEINPLDQQYIVKEILGAGSFGTVVHGIDRYTKEDVAVKIISKSTLSKAAHKKFLYREIQVLSMLSHRGIVKFRNSFQDAENVYIVTEFCPDGTLHEFVEHHESGVEEEKALLLIKQVFEALQYLHSKAIAHRDVKLENAVFVGNELKLIDFGLCSARSPGGSLKSTAYCGTQLYAAPEVMNRVPYIPEKADMWSCGAMLYAMLSGDKRFFSSTSVDSEEWDGTPSFLPELMHHISRGTAVLLTNLLNEEPGLRPSAEEALDLLHDALWHFCYREV